MRPTPGLNILRAAPDTANLFARTLSHLGCSQPAAGPVGEQHAQVTAACTRTLSKAARR